MMEDQSGTLNEILQSLRLAKEEGAVDTIPAENFRFIVSYCSRLSRGTTGGKALLPGCLSELADLLLYCLSASNLPLDVQAAASVAFSLVLSLIQEAGSVALLYSKTFLPLTDHLTVRLSKGSELSLPIKNPSRFKLSLIYGLLQADALWSNGHALWEKLLKEKLFPLIEKHCFEYSRLTLLGFKTLSWWARRCEASPQPLSPDLISRLAAIVVSNWENPYHGVREEVSSLASHLLNLSEASEAAPPALRPPAFLKLVLTEASWHLKSKYFLLAALLPKYGVLKALLEEGDDLVSGLSLSLSYPHLAPAGTELYRVCIESISLDQWEQTFLKPILDILLHSQYMHQKQNVFNYWMPCTIKKYKTSLQVLLDNLLVSSSGEVGVFPVVSCLKLGRKEGYERMSWSQISSCAQLLRGLKHHDPLVRAQSFATVCHSSKTASLPSDNEFAFLETFLTENINSDSAPLRQSIYTSFQIFLSRLNEACLHILKTKLQHESQFENRALTRSMNFLEWLYTFLKTNLEIGVNYQRKIASLELYKIVLNVLANENNSSRKSLTKQENQRVMKYAIGVSKWGFTSDRSREILLYCISDPSEDVREAAAHILVNYFKMSETEAPRFAELFRKALTLSSDMMFYNADAGALLIYTLTTLAYKTGTGPKALDIKTKRVSETLILAAEDQSRELRADLLKAATGGSPLYGVLQALRRLLTSPSSPEYGCLEAPLLGRLVSLLDETVRHLLQVLASKSLTIADYAPSFREMGEEIESTIQESSVSVEESDKLHLSPAHQLILNTVWLNLKACCWLSSKLPGGGLENAVRVLRHCRHKGAVEAAGGALAGVVRARPVEGVMSLCQALERLSAGQTQSSRGAGGVVLVHRLVASDTRPNKPMVEKALSHILSLVERKTGDLAQCLHILTVLVKDASLGQETASYLHRITPAALACLTHTSWPVRNAALQLFGAIVPKLVGQRKPQQTGADEEKSCSCYHLPYEELYLHCEGLVNQLLESLESAATVNTSQPELLATQSRLVPLLSLLSQLSVGLLTIVNRSLESVFHRFVASFQALMASPIFKVRELSAKANAWFCSNSQLGSLIRTRVWKIVAYINDPALENEIKSENELHGFLLNTKFLLTRFNDEKDGLKVLRSQDKIIKESIDELKPLLISTNISYICRCVLKELCGFDSAVSASRQMEDLLHHQTASHKEFGLPHWLCLNAKQIMENCLLSELLPTLNIAVNSSSWEIIESCLQSLEIRVCKPEFEAVSNGTINALFRLISNRAKARCIDSVLKVILEIISRYEISPINLNLDNVIENLLCEDSPVGLAVMCGLIQFRREVETQLVREVVNKLFESCDPRNILERREFAGRGLSLVAPMMLESATEECLEMRVLLWQAGVTLLQDESPEVRHLASLFANSLTADPRAGVPNPYSSLIFLHEESTMNSLFPSKQILRCLWSELKCSPEEMLALQDAATTISNPFDNPTPNTYQETVKITELARDRLLSLITKERGIGKILVKEEILPYLKQLREHCLIFITFSEEHTIRSPILINREWYITAKKLGDQFKIINHVNNSGSEKDLEMFHYRFLSCLENATFKY